MELKEKIIAKRIKECREANKINQKELANMIDVTPSAVNQYEKGEKTPSTKTLLKLAKALGVTTDYLLGAKQENVTQALELLQKYLDRGGYLSQAEGLAIEDNYSLFNSSGDTIISGGDIKELLINLLHKEK